MTLLCPVCLDISRPVPRYCKFQYFVFDFNTVTVYKLFLFILCYSAHYLRYVARLVQYRACCGVGRVVGEVVQGCDDVAPPV